MALADFLHKKGPFGLPMPVVIVAGAGAAYYLYTRNAAASDATTTGDGIGADTGQGSDASAFQPDAAGIPGSSTTYVTKNIYKTSRRRRRRHHHPGRRISGGRIGGRTQTSAARAIASKR